MVKRTITITTILIILTMSVGLIIMLNKPSFGADIANGTSGTCSWIIDSEGVLTIRPTNGVSGTLAEFTFTNYTHDWQVTNLREKIKKVVIEEGVKTGQGCYYMFASLTNCTEIDLFKLDTSDATNMSTMFSSCAALTTINLSSFNTENVTDMSYMFFGCKALTTIDLSSFNTKNVTDMHGMFDSCYALTSIDVSAFNTEKVTNMSYMFISCTSLNELDVSRFNTSKVTSMSSMFNNCSNLTVLDVSNFDTSNVTNLSYMFRECSKVAVIDVSGFNTNKVTDMSGMFYGCREVTNIDISGFNTEKVTNMFQMFTSCDKITNLDVSSFDTKNVTNMGYMFDHCIKLEELDVSNFDTSEVLKMDAMFRNCRCLTSLILNNFNTNKTTSMIWMFENCYSLEYLDIFGFNTTNADLENIFRESNKLKKIRIGESFSFKGSSSNQNKYAHLPTPNELIYSGKWIHMDETFGPYTEGELIENYDGTTMKGTWIWERAHYSVTYNYTGIIPNGVSELPQDATYQYEDLVEVAQNATAPGYTFSGWSRTGTFEMPAEDVVITGSFAPRTDTPYIVERYLEDSNADTYSLAKTDNFTGITDTEATATPKDYEGFTFDDSIDGTKTSGSIEGDGSLVLKLYYKRNSYNVSYSYTGDIPEYASTLPQNQTYEYGAEINVPEDSTAEGYTFSGWIKDYITMPAQDIEITGYFIENPKSYSYKVEYFFDGEIDTTLEEILNAEKDEEISITPQTPLKHGEKNYTLVSDNHKITISINDEDNIIKVYYETDVLDYAIDNIENENVGDGIPDKYQIQITYKVENGKWDDGTQDNKIEIVTLKDKNGNYSEQGTGTLNIPEVGNNPDEGYTRGSWSPKIPSKVSSEDGGKEYIYSYKQEQKSILDIIKAEGKSSNPKTGDVFHRYLIHSALGIMVLIVAVRIRRKYSRKASKIQF